MDIIDIPSGSQTWLAGKSQWEITRSPEKTGWRCSYLEYRRQQNLQTWESTILFEIIWYKHGDFSLDSPDSFGAKRCLCSSGNIHWLHVRDTHIRYVMIYHNPWLHWEIHIPYNPPTLGPRTLEHAPTPLQQCYQRPLGCLPGYRAVNAAAPWRGHDWCHG